MTTEQYPAVPPKWNEDNKNTPTGADQSSPDSHTPEIATNDGSVEETLDTVFHGTHSWVEGENLSGSNRADYYESRSYGKTDAEEELEAREKQEEAPE